MDTSLLSAGTKSLRIMFWLTVTLESKDSEMLFSPLNSEIHSQSAAGDKAWTVAADSEYRTRYF